MTPQNEYRIRIPVEVDQTTAHTAPFRVATSAIALDVYAATPDLAVEIVTRAIDAVVASNEFGPPAAPPGECHPGAACSKPKAKHTEFEPSTPLTEARAQYATMRERAETAEALAVVLGDEVVRLNLALTGAQHDREAAEGDLADLRAQVAKLSAFGETLHRVRAALEGAGEPAAPGRSAPIGVVPFVYRMDE